MSTIQWQKSSYSANQGNCIELASSSAEVDGVLLRESDRPEEIIGVSRDSLRALVLGVKAGEFDHLI